MFAFVLQLSNREKAPFLLTAAQITALVESNPKLQPSFSFSSCVVLSSSLGLGSHRKPIVFCVEQSLLSHAVTLRCCSALTSSLFPFILFFLSFFSSIRLDMSLLSWVPNREGKLITVLLQLHMGGILSLGKGAGEEVQDEWALLSVRLPFFKKKILLF